jgi:hypothetical protein
MIRRFHRKILSILSIALLLEIKYSQALSESPSSTTKLSPSPSSLTTTKVISSYRTSTPFQEIRGGEISSEDNDTINEYFQQEQESTVYNTASNDNNNYQDGFANYYIPSSASSQSIPDTNDPEHIFHETVQERVDRWRESQMETYGQQISPEQEANPRDAQGRSKLLLNASKAARAVIFFVLMMRDIYFFEMIDQCIKEKGIKRVITRTLVTTLFLGNMAGAVGSLTTVGHSAKKRFKAILNLDKLAEICLLIWNFLRLTIFPSKYVLREVYIAGMIHSLFFLLQAQAFTRLTWDESVAPVPKRNSPSNEDYARNAFYPKHFNQYDDSSSPLMYASNNIGPANQNPYQSYSDSY